VQDRGKYFRDQAEACRVHAAKTPLESNKVEWLKLAQDWLKLAENTDSLARHHSDPQPISADIDIRTGVDEKSPAPIVRGGA
jgi:hypothetical protein